VSFSRGRKGLSSYKLRVTGRKTQTRMCGCESCTKDPTFHSGKRKKEGRR